MSTTLVIGLPGTGKTTYVKEHRGNALVYDLDYIKAADKVLKKIPHICEMDIGHTTPYMTLINGALIDVRYRQGKGSIAFKLK